MKQAQFVGVISCGEVSNAGSQRTSQLCGVAAEAGVQQLHREGICQSARLLEPL